MSNRKITGSRYFKPLLFLKKETMITKQPDFRNLHTREFPVKKKDCFKKICLKSYVTTKWTHGPSDWKWKVCVGVNFKILFLLKSCHQVSSVAHNHKASYTKELLMQLVLMFSTLNFSLSNSVRWNFVLDVVAFWSVLIAMTFNSKSN